MFASGWIANEAEIGLSHPANAASLVDEAQEAYEASQARAKMVSQVQNNVIDHAEISQCNGVVLPKLPAKWTVTDTQLYPSDLGNSVVVNLVTPEDEQVSLFAAEEETSISELPSTEVNDGVTVAYWEEGSVALALVGEVDAPRLQELAEDLADDS